jgi:hypothetical protein
LRADTIFFTSSLVPFCIQDQKKINNINNRISSKVWKKMGLTHFQFPPTKNFLAIVDRGVLIEAEENGF